MKSGKTWAIGDIHGCSIALKELCKNIELSFDDRLIILGDIIDRGPDSSGALDWLIEWKEQGQLIVLEGNHEAMMLDAQKSTDDLAYWKTVGGAQTMRSYGSPEREAELSDVPTEHWRFLKNAIKYYETDRHFFVHANAYPDMELSEQPDYMLLWEHLSTPSVHQSGKTMVCGHTPQKSGLPLYLGHTICLDTWAHGGGWLTALDLGNYKYHQANQQREARSGHLFDLEE